MRHGFVNIPGNSKKIKLNIVSGFLFFLLLSCDSNSPEKLAVTTLNSRDTVLIKILAEIDIDDQQYRREIEKLLNEGSADTAAFSTIGKKIGTADSINQIKVVALLDSSGWPQKDVIGEEGSKTIWAVLQHSSLEVQEKYFPLLLKAVLENNADAKDAAYLEDRMLALGKGLKQKYGTQLSVTVGSTE